MRTRKPSSVRCDRRARDKFVPFLTIQREAGICVCSLHQRDEKPGSSHLLLSSAINTSSPSSESEDCRPRKPLVLIASCQFRDEDAALMKRFLRGFENETRRTRGYGLLRRRWQQNKSLDKKSRVTFSSSSRVNDCHVSQRNLKGKSAHWNEAIKIVFTFVYANVPKLHLVFQMNTNTNYFLIHSINNQNYIKMLIIVSLYFKFLLLLNTLQEIITLNCRITSVIVICYFS